MRGILLMVVIGVVFLIGVRVGFALRGRTLLRGRPQK